MLPITALAVVPWGLLARYLEFKKIAICELADVVVNAAVSVSMALLGMGVWSLVGGALAGLAASTLLLVVFSPWRPTPSRGSVDWGALLRFGGAVAVMSLAFYWSDRVVNLLVGRLLGSEALGLYVVAFNLAIGVAGQVSAVTRVVAFPAFSAIQHDALRLAAAYKRAVRWSVALAFPACALMAVLAPQLISVFLGPQWTACILPFRLLLAVGAMRSLYGFSGLVLRSVGRPQTELLVQVLFASGVAAASFTGARAGIAGVAGGVACFVCFAGGPLFITMAARVSRIGLLSVLRCASGPAIAAVAAAAVASIGGQAGGLMWPEVPALGTLVVGGAAGLLTYALTLRLVAGDLFAEARSRLMEALRARSPGRASVASTSAAGPLRSQETET
jgi:PST family polysaccharide transporter